MRRLWGGVLLGLGVFLIVLAGLFRFFVADRAILTPIDQYTKTVAPGAGTYFDTASLSEKRADLTATRILRGDVAASTADVGVWDVSVAVETGDTSLVRASLDRVAFDRKTAESVDCCGAGVDGEPVRHEGVTYKFPFDTEQQDYLLWDVNSRKSYPARYRRGGGAAGPDRLQVRAGGPGPADFGPPRCLARWSARARRPSRRRCGTRTRAPSGWSRRPA